MSIPTGEERISQRLTALASEAGRERISVADILTTLGDRGFGLLLLLLTLPNAVPIPGPGLSAILALPAALLAAQMALGLPHPRLPAALHRWSLPQTRFAAVVSHARPGLERLERLLRRRRPLDDRLIGVVCLLLALVLALPIPFGNLPVAWALIVVALGTIERDGLATLLGMIAGGVAVGWNLLLILAGREAVALVATLTESW